MGGNRIAWAEWRGSDGETEGRGVEGRARWLCFAPAADTLRRVARRGGETPGSQEAREAEGKERERGLRWAGEKTRFVKNVASGRISSHGRVGARRAGLGSLGNLAQLAQGGGGEVNRGDAEGAE